jgi:diguanylate cyclase (GGDEF)-like protein
MRDAPAASVTARLPSLRDPATWTTTDRCLLLAVIFLVTSVLFALCTAASTRDPTTAYAIDRGVADLLQKGVVVIDVLWGCIAAAALLIRRASPGSRALEHVTLQLIAVSLALAGHYLGLATTPFALAQLGALVVGLLLFRRVAVLAATATCAVLAIALEMASALGVLRYGPLFREIPVTGGRIAPFFHFEMLLLVVVTVGVVLGVFLFMLGRLRDREAHLELLSKTDPLTGLRNRREFFGLLERELARAARRGTALSIAILDLDQFKSVNDRHGHLVGDTVLREAARIVSEGLRREDLLARYGGEEFVMLLPDTDIEGARAVAERCLARLQATPVPVDGGAIAVTASFGVATRGRGETTEDLIRAADEALYRAKRNGRNRVEVATAPPRPVSMRVEKSLVEAARRVGEADP